MNKKCYLLLVFLICCTTELVAQSGSQTAPVFPLGVWATGEQIDYQPFFNSLDSSGLNTLLISVSPDNNTLLEPYKVITQNGQSQQEAVYHYSNGMYTKWEGENLQENTLRTGILHKFGLKAFYDGDSCWTTGNDAPPRDSLIYGPHYRQDKNYRLGYDTTQINFTVKYSIALEDPSANPLDDVCEIKVVFCYLDDQEERQCTTLALETITVANFSGNSFQVFNLEYTYPLEFINPVLGPEGDSYESGNFGFDDTQHDTGIEFQLDWLGTGTLYVDYVEVYDNKIWEQWVNPLKRDSVVNKISTFLSTYSGSEWDNIIQYWFGRDEPQSIDYYEPMRVVDSLIRTIPGGRPLITQFYPQWNGWRNGDRTIPKFMELVNPDKLMFWNFPFKEGLSNEYGLNLVRYLLQEASENDPDFWYMGQGIGQVGWTTGQECGWRKPDSMELKASVMLALAHGAKGILFYKYSSTNYPSPSATCEEDVWFDAIVSTRDSEYEPSNLWYVIHDNLAPRLGGRLGNNLLSLSYEGNYNLLRRVDDPIVADTVYTSIPFLNLIDDPSYSTINFHAGELDSNAHPLNKHFLLANLITDGSRTASFNIENITNYKNVSARNVEGGIGELDTTIAINSSITVQDEFPPGEGKLYQLAPVVKYGGRLIYPEEIASETLYDDMVIENGATLGISGDYYVDADIIVKDGGSIVNTGNGKIIFYNDHKLILQGNSTLSGLSQSKLVLDFVSPTENNGIIADSGLVIIISNCEIKNAGTGITVSSFSSLPPESDDFRFRVDSVDFIGCEEFGINITGQYVNKAKIENSTFTGSTYGVSAVNLDETVIFNNYFTNTEMGIRLINITKADVIGNRITSNQYSMQGIFFDNSCGNLRTNLVQGHTNGIHLGNSSPDIGSSIIYDNKSWNLHWHWFLAEYARR